MAREHLTNDDLLAALNYVSENVTSRIEEKGPGAFASRHEILGIIAEEHAELIEAVTSESLQGVRSELLDIAVGCVVAIASIDSKKVDW